MKRVLILNRGEIACRLIQACQELGLETVAVYSDVDKNSRHAELADDAIREDFSRCRQRLIRFHVAKLNHIYAKACASGNLSNALRALRDLGRGARRITPSGMGKGRKLEQGRAGGFHNVRASGT